MDPNPQPTPTPAAAGPSSRPDPLVEFIRTDRQTAGYVLLGLSVVFLAATIWLAVKAVKTPAAEPDKTAEKAPDLLNPEAPKPEVTDPNRPAYYGGCVGALLGFLLTAGVGAWFVAGLPAPTVERQRTDARVSILIVGGGLGVLLILAGAYFFYQWSDSLTAWLDKGESKQARWVVIPLLMVIAGAGLLFGAVQPSRAEERNNTTLRRLVYGSNFALTVLLLFVVLVVANVAFAVRVPNRLDTTSTGFYTLSEPTREVLAQLDQPVTAYAILPDSGDRLTDDIRRLLQSCQDASGGKFKVRYVNPTLNKTELASLRAKYTQLELTDTGVLLTVGEDDKATPRYTFIRGDEFLDREAAMSSRQAQPVFAGEAKLVRELMFLGEAKQRPVVYFTQSNGELDISGGGVGGPEHSAAQLKAFLEKNYLDVRPLKFEPTGPKVPDDADIVIVAGPRTPFAPDAVGALRKFMNEPRPSGKKGKMIVLAGMPDPTTPAKPPTGLEPLLSEFNVNLGDKYIVSIVEGRILTAQAVAVFSPEAVRARNPIATTLRRFQASLVFPREVTSAAVNPANPGNPNYRTTKILETIADLTWLEDRFPDNVNQMIADMRRNPAAKQVTQSKSVGVVVSESVGAGRLAVYGSSIIASDEWASQTRGTAPVEFDLIGVTIDWARERPPVPTGVISKTYTAFTFPPKVDSTRILWFPLGLAFLTVAGLGAGVWVIRRK
jgi:hypothetical protein